MEYKKNGKSMRKGKYKYSDQNNQENLPSITLVNNSIDTPGKSEILPAKLM